jgi:hypothetical protein
LPRLNLSVLIKPNKHGISLTQLDFNVTQPIKFIFVTRNQEVSAWGLGHSCPGHAQNKHGNLGNTHSYWIGLLVIGT